MGVSIVASARRAMPGGVRARSLVRSLAVAAFSAALALVALPTGASADPRVPPPACPPDVSLQGVERAPGGVILLGAVTSVTPEVGRVRLEVLSWYHRGVIPGLAAGQHPAAIDVMLGPRLSASGRVAVAHLPQVGSRFLVAGTWPVPTRGVSVACGIFANTAMPVGEAWLERADAIYAAVAPSTSRGTSAVPLDAPWFLLGMAAAAAFLVAMVLGAMAEAREPAPAV